MGGFVDIHCHVLPGVDDGPADVVGAVALVEGLAELGFVELHPTPHQRAHRWAPSEDERESAAGELRAALSVAGCRVRVARPAGENMWDELFASRQADASYPLYEGDKAFLLELSPELPPPNLAQLLFEMRLRGHLPVLAHVERYASLADDEDVIDTLHERAALLVNISSLGGMGGWGTKRRARRLVRRGLAHALTTDAHGEPDLAFTRKGLSWLRRELDDSAIDHLLADSPRRLLAGEL